MSGKKASAKSDKTQHTRSHHRGKKKLSLKKDEHDIQAEQERERQQNEEKAAQFKAYLARTDIASAFTTIVKEVLLLQDEFEGDEEKEINVFQYASRRLKEMDRQRMLEHAKHVKKTQQRIKKQNKKNYTPRQLAPPKEDPVPEQLLSPKSPKSEAKVLSPRNRKLKQQQKIESEPEPEQGEEKPHESKKKSKKNNKKKGDTETPSKTNKSSKNVDKTTSKKESKKESPAKTKKKGDSKKKVVSEPTAPVGIRTKDGQLLEVGWTEEFTDDGEPYYYNETTDVSVWDAPTVKEKTSKNVKKRNNKK